MVSFAVILATLLLQGLSLPAVIRALGLKDDGGDLREEREALLLAAEAAVARLGEMSTSIVHPQLMARVQLPYQQRIERLSEQTRDDPECRLTEGEEAAFRKLRGEALNTERKVAVALRNQGRIRRRGPAPGAGGAGSGGASAGALSRSRLEGAGQRHLVPGPHVTDAVDVEAGGPGDAAVDAARGTAPSRAG